MLDELPVYGVNEFQEGLVCRAELALLQAEDAVYLIRPPEPVVDDIPVPASHVRYLLGPFKALFAFLQRQLRLLSLGYVGQEAADRVRSARRVEKRELN